MRTNWLVYLAIIVMVIVLGIVGLKLPLFMDNQYYNTTLTTSYTSMYPASASNATINTSTITKTTSTIDISGLRSYYQELLDRAKELRWNGFDTVYAEYLLLSTHYYYVKGNVDKALSLLDEAKRVLENARKLPENPPINYNIVDNTLYVKKIPSTWDFVPIGTVFVLSDRGYLAYPSNDLGWKLSCFIIIAWGKSGDGEWFAYQGRLPLAPWEGVFRPRIFVKGKWHVLDIVFAGPLYYDNGSRGLFKYPTVYEYDLSGKFMEYLTYIPSNRTWIHGIIDVSKNKTLLLIRAHGIGIPMWLGVWNESYLVHGVYSKRKGLDLWAGFWDVGLMTVRVNMGGFNKEYHGVFVFDRASHHVYGLEKAFKDTGAPLSFSCMVIYQDKLVIMVTSTVNPSPWNPDKPFEYQLRINLLDRNITIDAVDFHLEDDGSLQPKVFKLWGYFKNGYFNLTGHVIAYWPSKWPKGHRTWWSNNTVYSWGRAFTKWTGIIVYKNNTIHVNAIGVGEYTRAALRAILGEEAGNNTACKECCWCSQP